MFFHKYAANRLFGNNAQDSQYAITFADILCIAYSPGNGLKRFYAPDMVQTCMQMPKMAV